MLVLTRKQQEKIQIGDEIVITVLKTKGKTVRLGIEAPSNVPVLRGELVVRMADEAQAETTTERSTAPLASTDADHREREHLAPGAEQNWDGHSQKTPRVTLERVPRSRVATVLPSMLGASSIGEVSTGDHGPLRAMMDRRAGSAL